MPDSIDIRDDDMVLSFEQLQRNVFDPTVSEIISLIKKQIDLLPKSPESTELPGICENFFLVGGFGQNPYLRQRIEAEFVPKKIKRICNIEAPGLATVKGSVLQGLNPGYVANRICSRSYGISEGPIPNYGKIKCSSLICKGEKVKVAERKSYKCKLDKNYKLPVLTLYSSDEKAIPQYIDISQCSLAGTLTYKNKIRRAGTRKIIIHVYFGLWEITATVEINGKEYNMNFES